MIKPDGVARGLENEILGRIKQAGLKVEKSQKLHLSQQRAADLYAVHLGKNFYPGLIEFITSGPVMVNVVSGKAAIAQVRQLMGATDPREAAKGTIRGDLKEENVFTAQGTMKNIVHGSDSLESARKEIGLFFGRNKSC